MEYITKTIIYNIISRLYWRLKDERIIVPQDQTMAAIKHILKGLQSREWKALKINSSSNDTINGITRKEWNQLTNYLINKKSKSAQYLWKSYLNALIVGPKIYTKIDPLAWQISWKKVVVNWFNCSYLSLEEHFTWVSIDGPTTNVTQQSIWRVFGEIEAKAANGPIKLN